MAKHTDRVRIEEVDWLAVFPWIRLLGSFKMAMHPTKLLTSLLLIVILFFVGRSLDLIVGGKVPPSEIEQYRQAHFGFHSGEQFEAWHASRESAGIEELRTLLRNTPQFKGDIEAILKSGSPYHEAREQLHTHYLTLYQQTEKDREQTGFNKDWKGELTEIRNARARVLTSIDAITPRGAFDETLRHAIRSVDRLVRSLVTFNFGISQAIASGSAEIRATAEPLVEVADIAILPESAAGYHDQTTSLSALRELFIILPGWLWNQHRLLLVAYILIALVFTAVLGGAVARMAAVQGTRDDRISLREALQFVLPRWWSFLLTPLMPLLLVGLTAALMGLGGFLLFNPKAWGVDIIGGVLFFFAILCGVIVMATVLLSAAGIHLAFPATAVNGADAFDAIARSFNYVLNRPWRWLFYNLIAVIHGALMYLLLTLMLALIIWALQHFTGMWVFTTTDLGVNRFEVIMPPAEGGGLSYDVDYASLDWSGRIAAFLVRCWMFLTIGVLAAFVVSYYLCANTSIYLLLRRDADGVEFEDLLIDSPVDPQAAATAIPPAQESAEPQVADEDED